MSKAPSPIRVTASNAGFEVAPDYGAWQTCGVSQETRYATYDICHGSHNPDSGGG